MKTREIDTAAWAEYWGVNRRSIQRWLKQGLPVDRPARMALYIIDLKSPAPGAKAKAEEILAKQTKGIEPEALVEDEAEEVEEEGEPEDFAEDAGNVNLEYLKGMYWRKLQAATKANREDLITYWDRKLRDVLKAIRDGELHAQRLGIEDGVTLPRNEVENLIRAMAFWLVRGIDQDMGDYAKKFLELNYVEEVQQVLDPYLLQRRLLIPFGKAASTSGPLRLPSWCVEILRDSVDDYIQNGADLFNEVAEVGKDGENAD